MILEVPSNLGFYNSNQTCLTLLYISLPQILPDCKLTIRCQTGNKLETAALVTSFTLNPEAFLFI